ncbi:MAG TPA: amine dehydrogenase large subunit [Candidatus Binataceae bacterium]|nr:amine dehydrogenase large subunit [Candidatus Binataceae bacterium]
MAEYSFASVVLMLIKRIEIVAMLAVAILLLVGAPSARAQLPADQMTTLTLPDPKPNWVYIMDLQFPVNMLQKIWIIDGETRKLLGTVFGGYEANFEISPDHREMYMIDTYYSRGWRGDRTDVVTIFDAHTTNVLGEIALPPKRLLIVPKRNTTSITPDGRFLLVANMTPATSVSIVDLKGRKFLGEIETPGCAQVAATGNRQFFSMCADGSMLTVQFDDSGKQIAKSQSKPLFDPNTDPMFDQPAVVGNKAYFVSYHGKVLPVDFSGPEAAAQPSWSLVDDKDVAQKWRPGGWQTVTYQAKSGILYALMHQGGEWTHKQFGTEVWAFNAQTHARVQRIKLKTPGYSIRVSNADKPILFDMSLLPSKLETYSAPDGKFLGEYDDIGSPFLLYGP